VIACIGIAWPTKRHRNRKSGQKARDYSQSMYVQIYGEMIFHVLWGFGTRS
jgi:hypothetical protein